MINLLQNYQSYSYFTLKFECWPLIINISQLYLKFAFNSLRHSIGPIKISKCYESNLLLKQNKQYYTTICIWIRFFPLEIISLDSYSKRMSQKLCQLFINEKLKKMIYFFTCILPYYVTHEITKEFWKNSYFENMTAGFLLWVKKHFGEIPLKRCIFNNEIFHFHQYWPCNSYCSH